MELWAWNQWEQGRIQNRTKNAAYCASASRPETMRAFIGLCPLCLGLLGPRLGGRRERSSFSLSRLLQTCHCHRFFTPRPDVFLSLGADWYPAALCHSARCVVLKALDCLHCCFLLFGALPICQCLTFSAQNRRIREELYYNQGQLLSHRYRCINVSSRGCSHFALSSVTHGSFDPHLLLRVTIKTCPGVE